MALFIALLCACLVEPAVQSSVVVSVGEHINTLPSPWLGFGQEMWQYMDALPQWTAQRTINTLKALGPTYVRVGGISADWIRYDTTSPCSERKNTLSAAGRKQLHLQKDHHCRHFGEWWPGHEENLTVCQFQDLINVSQASNVHLIFDLSELHGRNCTIPNSPNCSGYWHTRNVYDFLRYVHDSTMLEGTNFVAWELGNELMHPARLPVASLIEDTMKLSQIIQDIWTNSSTRPAIIGPAAATCDTNAQAYLSALMGTIAGYSYHSYPDMDDATGDVDLLNATWLRNKIIQSDRQGHSKLCLDLWNNGSRQQGVQLYLDETNSGYESPLYTYFINGFWYMASLGQYAQTGLTMHGRWSLIGRNFSLIMPNGTVSTDYFVALGFQRFMGREVMNVSTSSNNILAYGHCNRDDQLTLMLINPSKTVNTTISVDNYSGDYDAYIYTSPRNDMRSNVVFVNGHPMTIGQDGTPTMPAARKVNNVIQLPQLSYAFVISQDKHAQCLKN